MTDNQEKRPRRQLTDEEKIRFIQDWMKRNRPDLVGATDDQFFSNAVMGDFVIAFFEAGMAMADYPLAEEQPFRIKEKANNIIWIDGPVTMFCPILRDEDPAERTEAANKVVAVLNAHWHEDHRVMTVRCERCGFERPYYQQETSVDAVMAQHQCDESRRQLYNVFLVDAALPNANWAEELEQGFPGVHVMGADFDHGTFRTWPAKLPEIKEFLEPNYRVEPNTDGNILCDAVDLSM